MKWRLGLDIGSNSMGWAAFELSTEEQPEPIKIIGSGSRIFSDGRDPQDKQSNAAQRRMPRGQRRNRERYHKRRNEFMTRLIQFGLMPTDKTARKELEKEDPWILRARGLDEELTLHELGRALFHLQQRRGFKSNRKTDKGDKGDNDKGAVSEGTHKLIEKMKAKDAGTIGELMGHPRIMQLEENRDLPKKQRQALPATRARPTPEGSKVSYDFYPTRALILEEFNKLWAAQKQFHGDLLSDEARQALGDGDTGTLFFQRLLKPQKTGKCSLIPTDERAARALPSQQRFRIFQEFNNLRLRLPGQKARPLNLEERNLLVKKALATGKVTFDAMRKALKLPDARFTTESKKRKHLDGDKTAFVLTNAKRWGKDWRQLPFAQQEEIVTRLLEVEEEEELLAWLMGIHGLETERAQAVADAPSDRNWPQSHGRLCTLATRQLLEWLSSEDHEAVDPETGVVYTAPFVYSEAARLAGYDSHSDLDGDNETALAELPYYGEVLERHVAFGSGEPKDHHEKCIGKLANPTVHVVLNQLRKLVNALASRYSGMPCEIIVEMARDLPLSARGKKELEKEQADNQKANEARSSKLEKISQNQGIILHDNYENRLRLRLYEELEPLNHCCPYTGDHIGLTSLFSPDIEIDHILPFSRTLDDGIGNKTLCLRHANRAKGNRSPHEAFHTSPPGYDWEKITQSSDNLPGNKSWRFAPDAMERFEDEERDFLARQLNDTKYASRLARTYLRKTGADVWVTPGRLTADLRHVWGLNSVLQGHNRQEEDEGEQVKKNRNDHRHHAIDAAVIAMTDRSQLNKAATAAGRLEKDENLTETKLLKDLAPPWPSFRDDVAASIRDIIVSHKPDHGVEGQLHEDTAYGRVQDPVSGAPRLVTRKPVTSLTAKQIANIGDLKIREELLERTNGLNDKERREALEAYSRQTGTRRVRIHKVQAEYEVIRHGRKADGNPHEKAVIPGENFCVDLIETPDGIWHGVGVTRFEANRQKRHESKGKTCTPLWQRAHPNGRLLMRVHKGDLIKLHYEGEERVMRVVKLQPSNSTLALAEHIEAGQLQKRHDTPNEKDAFRWDFANFGKLKERKARRVFVDPTGQHYDPGPHK